MLLSFNRNHSGVFSDFCPANKVSQGQHGLLLFIPRTKTQLTLEKTVSRTNSGACLYFHCFTLYFNGMFKCSLMLFTHTNTSFPRLCPSSSLVLEEELESMRVWSEPFFQILYIDSPVPELDGLLTIIYVFIVHLPLGHFKT